MKPIILPIAIGLALLLGYPFASVAADADPEGLFEKGNRAYGEQQYEQAESLYDSLLRSGWVSADLYYNLGNAHFRQGHIGQSILQYERCLRLDPQHTDALFNLRQARARIVDNLAPMPAFVLTRWSRKLVNSQSPTQWGYLGMLLLWLAVGAAAGVFFAPRVSTRRTAFIAGIVMGISAFACLGLGWMRQTNQMRADEGIITAPNAYVKDAPDGQTDLLILHEGIKVELLDQVDGWRKLRLQGANIGEVVGFVPSDRVEVI